jgi:hypothetical protein
MKKLLIIIFLFYFSIFQVYSQETSINIFNSSFTDEDGDDYDYTYFNQFGIRILFDASLRYFFPVEKMSVLTFLCIGFGLGIDIFNNILSPGIYLDIGIGTDWFAIFGFLDPNRNSSKTNDDKREYNQFAYSGGLRIYNIIKIYPFYLIPFAGYNFLYFYIPLPNVGISLSYKDWGFEYAYYFSTNSHTRSHHHISLRIPLYNNYLKK